MRILRSPLEPQSACSSRSTPPGDRQILERYMHDAPAVLSAPGMDEDVYDPSRGRAVPLVFHSDGTWIWSAAHAYYFLTHNLPLEAEFLSHVLTRRTPPRALSKADQDAAVAAIYAYARAAGEP